MNRALQSLFGALLIGTDVFLLVTAKSHSEWFHVVLLAGGGWLISKSLVVELIETAAEAVKTLLPWKADGG